MIRETPHCCRVSVGQTGEDVVVLSKQLASSGNTGVDKGAGESGECPVAAETVAGAGAAVGRLLCVAIRLFEMNENAKIQRVRARVNTIMWYYTKWGEGWADLANSCNLPAPCPLLSAQGH